jgi:hypothetical protein
MAQRASQVERDTGVERTKITKRFVTSYPFNDLYVENPFSSDVRIKNKRAGYKPVKEYIVYNIEKEEDCQMILPRNTCYTRYRTIVEQP